MIFLRAAESVNPSVGMGGLTLVCLALFLLNHYETSNLPHNVETSNDLPVSGLAADFDAEFYNHSALYYKDDWDGEREHSALYYKDDWDEEREQYHHEDHDMPRAHAAAKYGDMEELKRIASESPEDLHAMDSNGWTPIHEAVWGEHYDAVEFLIKEGADFNHRSNHGDGGTPLHLATYWYGPNHPIVHLFAHVGARDVAPLPGYLDKHAARYYRDDWDEEREQYHHEDLEIPVVHGVVKYGYIEHLKMIAKESPHELHTIDENGWAPLHEAVWGENFAAVELLIQEGADFNQRANHGDGGTPLHLAKYWFDESHPIVNLLRDVGARDIGPTPDL